jgi:hypothetical protein
MTAAMISAFAAPELSTLCTFPFYALHSFAFKPPLAKIPQCGIFASKIFLKI